MAASESAVHLQRPLRVLCLHGFGETTETMLRRVGPLQRALQGECVFIVPEHSEPWCEVPGPTRADRGVCRWRASSLCCPSYGGWEDTVEFLSDFEVPFESSYLGSAVRSWSTGYRRAIRRSIGIQPRGMFSGAAVCHGTRTVPGAPHSLHPLRYSAHAGRCWHLHTPCTYCGSTCADI